MFYCPYCTKLVPTTACCGEVHAKEIITSYDYPPIPIRSMDWSAHFDDYDGAPDSHHPHGHGPTERAAIDDLIEQETA